MPERTDQAPISEDVRALLHVMADRLDNEDPDEPITEADRLALCHELTHGDDPHYSALRALSAEPWRVSTRGEYAARLRERAGVR